MFELIMYVLALCLVVASIIVQIVNDLDFYSAVLISIWTMMLVFGISTLAVNIVNLL